jgi:hypothetical protein
MAGVVTLPRNSSITCQSAADRIPSGVYIRSLDVLTATSSILPIFIDAENVAANVEGDVLKPEVHSNPFSPY